jgi:hypothetical protein
MARPISTDSKIFLAGLLYIPVLVLGLFLIVAGNMFSPFTRAALWLVFAGSVAGPFWLRRRLRSQASTRNNDVASAEPYRTPVIGPDAQYQQHGQSAPTGSQELRDDRGKQATKPCPFCAEEILIAATKCKHCGSTLNASTASLIPPTAVGQTNAKKFTLGQDSIFALFVIGVATLWWLSDKQAVEHAREPSADVSAYVTSMQDLKADYEANEVATQLKIGNSVIKVSGVIESISIGFGGDGARIEFQSGGTVVLPVEDQPKAAKLQKGEMSTFTCSSMSYILGSPYGTHCVIADVSVVTPSGPTQAEFCSLVQSFRIKYQDAQDKNANQAALSELRHDRRQALASVIGNGEVTGWTGTIENIYTDSGGAAQVTVQISCGEKPRSSDRVTAAMDYKFLDHTSLINETKLARGTPLYSAIIKLKEGSRVTFDGTLITDNSKNNYDYIHVNAITERGSMTDPVIAFIYKAIAPLNGRASTREIRSDADREDESQINVAQPSFDCAKARSPAEVLICGDPELAALDNEFSTLYKRALGVVTEKATFIRASRNELRQRELTCFDKSCLVAWYAVRRSSLEGVLENADAARSPKPSP